MGILNANCDLKDADPTFVGLPFDQFGSPGAPLDPGLGPLADNGGFTRTHALLPGSPAINADNSIELCPRTDQRGFRRPGDDAGDVTCDAGAYEAGGTALAVDPTPETSITKAPKRSRSTRARLEFISDQANASFECALDKGGYRPCSSPKRYRGLSRRRHRFSVRAISSAGMVDLTPATVAWRVKPAAK